MRDLFDNPGEAFVIVIPDAADVPEWQELPGAVYYQQSTSQWVTDACEATAFSMKQTALKAIRKVSMNWPNSARKAVRVMTIKDGT
jgi:hypothetical protein